MDGISNFKFSVLLSDLATVSARNTIMPLNMIYTKYQILNYRVLPGNQIYTVGIAQCSVNAKMSNHYFNEKLPLKFFCIKPVGVLCLP